MPRRQNRLDAAAERKVARLGAVAVVFVVLAVVLAAACPATAQISFTKSTLVGAAPKKPTSLQFGPDGRLYVAQQNGKIEIYEIVRNAANDYQLVSQEEILLVNQIPNHDDDGTLNPAPKGRQCTGLYVTGTALNPVIYITSSDPRQGGGSGASDTNLDTNSGVISRVSWDGSGWVKLDLVRGLPRSEENHATNGIVLDEVGNVLYVAQGGNTNKGAPSNNFSFLTEYALSGAILSIDLTAIGETTHGLPTLDDEDRVGTVDAGDPFGGNDGNNQAILDPGGPVQVYAPGFRNAYDVIINSQGRMYTIDNGPNGGWGGVPVGDGTAGCTNDVSETAGSDADHLHFVETAGYYGGFANPTRGNMANTFNPTNPQSPVAVSNPLECDYLEPLVSDGALATWSFSTNGLGEYTASNFNAAMQGDLLTVSFDNQIWRIKLNAAGDAVTLLEPLFSNVADNKPLDVIAQGDGDPFPGTIWTANYASVGAIIVYEPVVAPPCSGANDAALDEDGDCYDNADEIANTTDPCSFADVPPDADGDCNSDLGDNDDDNDGLLDNLDPFAVDADNGTTTAVPLSFTWEAAAPAVGGLLGTGFTGLMTNSVSDYAALFDADLITFTNGKLTVDSVAEGDALDALNSQEFAFQMGIDAANAPAVFTVHTELVAPFLGITPTDFQSMGLFIGNGDQDNYIKIVAAADGGFGGVEVLSEAAAVSTAGTLDAVAMPGPDLLDLYLTVDQAALTVQPAYAVTVAGVPGPIVDLGAPLPLPAAWLGSPGSGLAVGIISTSRGVAPSFAASWELFEVLAGAVSCIADADCDDVNSCTTDSCLAGVCQFAPVADATLCDDLLSCTSPDSCTAGVCSGSDICPAGQSCDAATGQCQNVPCSVDADCPLLQVCSAGVCGTPGSDLDNDGLLAATDPCADDPRNLCVGPVAVDAGVGLPIRVNANAVTGSCRGDRADCNGDTWYADFGWNNQGNGAVCNLDLGCPITGLIEIFGCSDAATEDIFQCEHWDPQSVPPLIYSFEVADGSYVVNLLFAATFKSSTSGPEGAGSRVFDILAEGQVVYQGFDQVVAAGGVAGRAVVRSMLVEVSDGNGLQIEFAHVVGNPAIKGIEVLVDHDFTANGTQPGLNHDVLASGSCKACHGDITPNENIEPWPTWAGSMMAQAGRDPVFWAALDVANNDLPGIGEWCLRCHAPKAWLDGRVQAPGGSADGCGLVGNIDEVDNDFDGLDCHFCHRMMPNDAPPPGQQGVYLENGQFWLDDGDCNGLGEPCRRGPYSYPADGSLAPVHAWEQSDYHETSLICGNCHNVTNPLLTLVDSAGVDTGLNFPVERTYAEWLASDYAPTGSNYTTCQNCHMPDATASPAYACDDAANDHSGDMPIHEFAGGNAWVPEVLRLEYPGLNLDASLQNTRDLALDMLQNRSATLDLTLAPNFVAGAALDLSVRVTNLTGHKLPTGYPEGRRMWLHVEARDALGSLIWESGAYDASTGVLVEDSQAKVYEILHGMWNREGTGQCDVEDAGGTELFHFVLNNCVSKDNRIPPAGFSGGTDPEVKPYAYSYPETLPGSGILVNYDDTSYSIPVPLGTLGPISVTATLRYQTSSKEYIEFLDNEADANAFANDCIPRTSGAAAQHRGGILFDMWQNHGRSAPVDMAAVNLRSAALACTDDSDCADTDACTLDVCSPGGVCERSVIVGPCDDGDPCTVAEVCDASGVCAGTPKDCSAAADQCNDGVCSGATGDCVGQPKADGIGCDDGLFCSITDTCSGGVCSGSGDPCAGGSECNDVCNEPGQNCLSPAGAACADDGDVCTDDVCDGLGACAHPPGSAPCDDGVFCNGLDTCGGGSCTVHAGDPCQPGETCNESSGACDPPPCSQLRFATPQVCDVGRECVVTVDLASQGLAVSAASARFTSTQGLSCEPGCSTTTQGTCAIDSTTCSVQVADVSPPIDPLGDGAVAAVTLRCAVPGSGQICLTDQAASLSDGSAVLSCGDSCAPLVCTDCLSGDCNANGSLDAGDPICVLLCLIGQPPAGADCGCAADCNCLAGTEAADPICTVLRVIDLFTPDTCAGGGGPAALVVDREPEDLTADVVLNAGEPVRSRRGAGFTVDFALAGSDASNVAGVLTTLLADARIGRVRLSRRLRRQGFHASVGRPTERKAVVLVTPPIDHASVRTLGTGPLLRVKFAPAVSDIVVTNTQFGSRGGVPLLTAY